MNNKIGTITSQELALKELDPIKWIVPQILPEGLTILAAAPKTGKSFLALNLSFAVSTGIRFLQTYPTKKRTVLYFPFEDSERRIKDRIEAITESYKINPPDTLKFRYQEQRFDSRNLTDLETQIVETAAELVVIDTYAAAIKRNNSSSNVYFDDYESISGLRKLAQKLKIAILLIHHTNKDSSNAGLNRVSGSNGIAGAADSIWILEEETGYISFHIQGKDIENQKLRLEFDKETFLWTLKDKIPLYRITTEQMEIINLFVKEKREMRTSEIAKKLGKKESTVSQLLRKMIGIYIENIRYGVYALIPKTTESAKSSEWDNVDL